MSSGRLIVICGPMFAGKTQELIKRITVYRLAGKKVAIFKHAIDNRYSEYAICTHPDSSGTQKNEDAINVNSMAEKRINTITSSHDVIIIDEGNFFDMSLVHYCQYWCNHGKIVIVAGLNGDIHQSHFGLLHLLYPMADKIIHLHAICTVSNCGEKAIYTIEKHPSSGTSVLRVGGSDLYQSVCRKHLISP